MILLLLLISTNFVHSIFAFTQAGIKLERGETRILCLDSAHKSYSKSYDDMYQADVAWEISEAEQFLHPPPSTPDVPSIL